MTPAVPGDALAVASERPAGVGAPLDLSVGLPMDNPSLRWTDVERLVATVAAAVHRTGWQPDAVVAVARGGLTPAHLIAHRLNVAKVTSVGVRFADRLRTQMRVYAVPDWPHDKPARLLLVEDAVDTGRLIRRAASELPGEVRTAALVTVGEWRPDYVGMVAQAIPTMPWESNGGDE